MISQHFVYLALSFNVCGTTLYIIKALRGEVQPHLVTFLLWSFAPLVAFVAQIVDGAGQISLITLAAGITPAIIFVISIRNPQARWRVSVLDGACGVLAAAGIAFWWLSREANFAIVLAILADFLASIPTYLKSIRNPESESPILYFGLTLSAAITLLTIKSWVLSSYGFAAYLLLLGLTLTLITMRGQDSRHSEDTASGSGGRDT